MEEDLNDERAIELSSITAIYPEIVIDPCSPFRASLEIPVSPTVPLKVRFQQLPDNLYFPTPPTSLEPSDSGASNGTKDEERVPIVDGADPDVHTLSHLPPLTLGVELPDGYPSEEPPKFTLTSEPAWLPELKLAELLNDGRRLWEECGKDLIVFAYIDHLQQCAEGAFGLCEDQVSGATLTRDLKIALLDFDIKAKREQFERETFECGVCLEPKKGSSCHRLFLCSHVFCVPCLQDFYNACINEGDIDNVKCLSPNCGKNSDAPAQEDAPEPKPRKKQDRSLGPSELLQIPLEQEVVQRYVQLKRKRKLELDKTTVYCPREWCQGAARSKKHPKPVDPVNDDLDLSSDEEDEPTQFDPTGEEAELPPMSERVAICEDCSYAFCSVCRKGWHGELERCFPPRKNDELTEEEKATKTYLDTYTSPCPTCSAHCQKSHGCNHMICFKCRSHFCYLCSTWLIESNPYCHFNTPGSSCYMRLWDMEGGDGINPVGNWEEDDPLIALENDDDEENPEWEFADDSDDEPGHVLPRNQVRPPRPPPPPAPAPPRAIPPLNGNPNPGADDGLDAAGRAAAAEREALANAIAQARDRPAAVGRAPPPQWRGPNRRDAPQPPQQPRNGLQRFLELVQNDQEDEWDSDELDDDF